MITIYSTGCPKCKIAEQLLKTKGIKYEINSNYNEVISIANENGINSVPFADINGEIIDSNSLFKWINANQE